MADRATGVASGSLNALAWVLVNMSALRFKATIRPSIRSLFKMAVNADRRVAGEDRLQNADARRERITIIPRDVVEFLGESRGFLVG